MSRYKTLMLVLCAGAPIAAVATAAPGAEPMRFIVDVGERRSNRDLLRVEMRAGTISELRIRTAGVSARLDRRLLGVRLGSLSVQTAAGQSSYPLRIARYPSAGTATLLRRGSLVLTIRLGRDPVVTVRGLPRAAVVVSLSFMGRGSTVLGPSRSCPMRYTATATVLRRDGRTVTGKSAIRCGRPRG